MNNDFNTAAPQGEGMVAVPRVPTEAMVIAGCGPGVNLHTVYAIWNAMLAAALAPAAKPEA